MFESIRDSISSMAGKVYNAMPAINKKNAAIGAGVVVAGAAAYFGGPVLAECVNPAEVCVTTSRFFGLMKDTACSVPTTICTTAISKLAAGAYIGVKRLAVTLGVIGAGAAAVAAIARRTGSELAQSFTSNEISATPTAKTAEPSKPVQAATPTEESKSVVAAQPVAASATGTKIEITYQGDGKPQLLKFMALREDGTPKRVQIDMTKQENYPKMYGDVFVTEILDKLFDIMSGNEKPDSIQVNAKPKRLANTRPAVE